MPDYIAISDRFIDMQSNLIASSVSPWSCCRIIAVQNANAFSIGDTSSHTVIYSWFDYCCINTVL